MTGAEPRVEAVYIIMAKQPQPGSSKTRVCPPLSFEQAASLAEALLRDTIDLVSGLPGVDLAVAITPINAQPYFESITPPGTRLVPVQAVNFKPV